MTKPILLTLFALTFGLYAQSQFYTRHQLDSLSNSLQKLEGISRVNTLLHLSESYQYFNLDTALVYANMSQSESRQLSYDWGYYKSLYCVAKVFYENKPIKKVIPIVKNSLNWFTANNYEEDALHSEILYASCVNKVFGRSASKIIAEDILERAIKLGDPTLLGRSWLQIKQHPGSQLSGSAYPHWMDSAQHYMNIAKDSVYLIGLDLAKAAIKNGRSEGFQITRNSLKVGERWGNVKIICNSTSQLGLNHTGMKRIDSALYYYNKKIVLSEEYGSIGYIQNAFQSISYAYFYCDSLDLAIEYANKSLEICEEIHYYSDKSWLLNIVTYIHALRGSSEDAISFALQSLELATEQKDEYRIYSAQKMLGNFYIETEEYEKAKAIFKEALIWVDQGEDTSQKLRARGNLYLQIGTLNSRQKNYDKALESYKLAAEDLKESAQYAIGADIMILKTYLNQQKTEAARKHYDYITEIYSEKIQLSDKVLGLQRGRLLIAEKSYTKGIISLNNYLAWTKKTEHLSNSRQVYQNLHKAYSAIGNYKEALHSYVLYNTIDDSLKADVQKDNVTKIQSEYELSLKEKTIQDLRQQQELNDLRLDQQNQELEVRQLYLILMGFMLFIIAGVGYWLFRRFRLKKEQEENKMKLARAELEVENLQSKQQAEIAEVKNTLFANVSHEFRTPLTLIKVPIKSYMNKIPEKDRPIFDGVLNNTDQLLKLIDELLDVSRMESGTMELQKSTFNLHHFFTHVKSYFAPLFEEKQIDFKWNYLLNPMQFDADENRMKIVLNNLLKNAYSHTPENGTVVCTVTASKAPGIKITISNTGEGIKHENLPHIFERYFRGNEKDYAGNGIGLSLSKEIVEMHGGNISVEVSDNKLVSFNVELPGELKPVTQASLSQKQLEEKPHQPINSPQQQEEPNEKPTLLVVEDNLEIRNLLESTLMPEFKIITANDGEMGEKMALKHQPDIVLSDVMMPKKDGFELLGALKTNINSSHIPVVLLTAKADAQSKITGLNQDADDYIAKPFNPQELIARLQNLIRQRKHLQKLFNQNPLVHVKGIKCSDIDDAFFTKARTILEKNYQNGDFSVSDFCGELTLNRNSVHNKVMAFTNDNTSRYIKNFRLEKSAQMLMETTIAISDIYLKNGFNSSQAFNKAFKERFKLTPTIFREGKRAL